MMDLYLQFGWGMMEHCRQLLTSWQGGTAILSPRDLNNDQLVRLSDDINAVPNSRVLLDPQFYLPHSDHERLCSHSFWPADYDSGTFWQGHALTRLLRELNSLNDRLATAAFILPGLLASHVNDDWLETQRSVLEEAGAMTLGKPLYMTVALSGDSVRSDDQVASLLDSSLNWEVDGFYLVFEHPKGQYLVDDAAWLSNVIDISAGLKLRHKSVIIGYSNHQLLIAALAKADALASGTWMNVRSFPPDKFRSVYEEEIKQRALWVYSPQALSEYKLPFLDIAQRFGLLDLLAPIGDHDGGYVSSAFSGAQPSTTGLTEQAAFRHYLHSLRAQVRAAVRPTFPETVAAHTTLLDSAEQLLSQVRSSGVRGQVRDFSQIIDVNRAALASFVHFRGPVMSRSWASI